MDVNITITWLDSFLRKTKQSWEQVESILNRWIKKGIFHLQREAIPRTNVDTWTLRNSYTQKFWRLSWSLYNTREYWLYVHEGTQYITWNPFMKITAEKESGEVNKIMNKEMERYLAILN